MRKIRHICRLAACCVLALMLPAVSASAQVGGSDSLTVDPVGRSDNYSAVLYNNTNGLPTSEANAIAETGEGFIWIGSYGGLVRYDGNTFERMDSTTGLGSVVSLFVDSRDRLWIGTNESGIALMERGTYTFFGEKEGLAGSRVCSISEDESGNIYAGTTAGLSIISPEMEIAAVEDPRVAGAYIEHIRHGADGLMYITTNEDDCFTLKDGKVTDYKAHDETGIANVTHMLPDPDAPGKIYAGTAGSTLYYTDMKLDPARSEAVDISPLASVISLMKIDGKVWVCARNGIGVIDDSGFHHIEGLPMDNSVTQAMADYEGNLWFVSSRQGVMKLVSNRFFNVFERFGLEQTVVNSTCVLDGRLFIGTDTGLIALDDHEMVTELPLTRAVTAGGEDTGEDDLLRMLEGDRIRSIIRDSSNRLWISTWQGHGLICYDKQGTAEIYTEADGLLSDHVRAVYEAADGSMLVANTGGVSVIRDGKVQRSYSSEDGIDNPEILTVCAAPGGDILAGSNGGGIYVINGEGIRTIGTGDGLPSGIIMRIKYDSKRHVFWMVTSNSIAYMTEDYEVTAVTEFPYSNNFDLYENRMGDMWVLSSNGIYVVPVDELIANENIRPVYYSIANGLPCITTSNSYSELTAEGYLYIAGNSGVAQVNIESPMEDIYELKQAVPFIEADDTYYYPDDEGVFTLPYDVQKVTIYGYVYNYSLTDPQVTYRLEGFDREPVTLKRSGFGPVTYTNLPGGTYEFIMELSDAMGRGRSSIKVRIVKEKALYEQTLFYLIVGSVIALTIFVLVMSYINRRLAAMEAKHREEAERERIAMELQTANNIQMAMMPEGTQPFPDRPEFEIHASIEPAREIGGDFYDFFLIDDDHLCIVVADVSGKGVPAALFMMVSKVILKIYATMGRSPGEILERTNDRISSNNRLDMFVTVWLGILEISTGRLTAANAGHEYPVLRRAGGSFKLFRDEHSMVIGGFEGVKYKEYQLELAPGDKIFLYTDGITEASDIRRAMFGTDRMIKALNKDPEAGPEEALGNVRSAVREFVDKAEQFDDMTMLCLDYRGGK